MKATTSVPTRDASVLLYPLSNVLKVSRARTTMLKRSSSLIVDESEIVDRTRVDLPKLYVRSVRRG